MNQIAYTVVSNIEDTLQIKTHATGHVYMIYKGVVLLGYTDKHYNIFSIGGFVNENNNETLFDTIVRECQEETLDCIIQKDDLLNVLINNSVGITRKSPKGQHYTFFCDVSSLDLDLKAMQREFLIRRSNPNLTKDQQETDRLVGVELKMIKTSIEQSTRLVTDVDGTEYTIRDINEPAYKWLFSVINEDFVRAKLCID